MRKNKLGCILIIVLVILIWPVIGKIRNVIFTIQYTNQQKNVACDYVREQLYAEGYTDVSMPVITFEKSVIGDRNFKTEILDAFSLRPQFWGESLQIYVHADDAIYILQFEENEMNEWHVARHYVVKDIE